MGKNRFCLAGFVLALALPLGADDLRWAEEKLAPPEQAPEGLRNNLSLEMLSAAEGLFQLRFQRYFRDSVAGYIQLQLGSHLVSSLRVVEMSLGETYERWQLGFELGLSSLLYARNPKITKDIRRWGSGLILGLGLRFMYHNIAGGIQDNILGLGPVASLGWQLQARNFSISMYLELRLLLQISTQSQAGASFPVILDRGLLGRLLPAIPIINSSQVSSLAQDIYYTFSQSLNIRISYYF